MTSRPARVVTRSVLLLGVAAVAALIVAAILLPRAVGGTTLTVLSGSMQPTIAVGSTVVVRPIDANLVERGDIVTFVKPDLSTGGTNLVTHRVVEVLPSKPVSFVMKGDANPGRDIAPVFGPNVVGEVWYSIPYLGTAQNAAASLRNMQGLGLLLAAGLLIYALGQLREGVRLRTRSRRAVQLPHVALSARFDTNIDLARVAAATSLTLGRALTHTSPGAVTLTWLIDADDLGGASERLRGLGASSTTASGPLFLTDAAEPAAEVTSTTRIEARHVAR